METQPAKFPDWKIEEGKLYRHRPDPLIAEVIGDLQAWKLVVPKPPREKVLEESHSTPSAGHFGVEKTFRRIAENFYWPGYYEDTAKFVKHCLTCQACKVEQAPPIGQMDHKFIDQPWQTVAADIFGSVT